MDAKTIKKRLERGNLNEDQKNALILDLLNRIEALEAAKALQVVENPNTGE